jgi:hypothetical protein
MNNPMSRKLFQTREAREKLRGMGGILASSPELSQTVARFNNGGDITVPLVGRTPFDIIAQRVPGMTQREMIEAGLPRAGLPRREIVEMMRDPSVGGGGVDINIGPEEFAEMSREERLAAGFSNLGALNEAYFAARERLLESQFPMQGPSMPPPAPTTSLSPENFINPADEFANLTSDMTDPYQLPEMVIDSSQATPPPVTGEGPYTGALRSDIERQRRRLTPDDYRSRGETDSLDPRSPSYVPPAETAAPVTQETSNSTGGEAEADSQRLQAAQLAAAKVVTGGEETGGGETGAGSFDFDVSFEQALDRVGRVMGDAGAGDDEDSRKKAMANLAMIGLAIAAGQSPNALTNIAQGALSGMQAIQAQEAREADLTRESRLSALEMTEKAADRASAERIAAMRLGTVGEETRQEYLYNATFSATLTGLIAEGVSAEEAATRAAAIAAQAAPNAPSAGSATVPLSAMKAAEDQARALGQTEFTFGGQRYPVRPAS